MNFLLLLLSLTVSDPNPQSDVQFVDQYGRVYELKENAFEDPRVSPLKLVEGKEITLKKATTKQKEDNVKVQKGLVRCRNATCRVLREVLVYRKGRYQKMYNTGTGTVIREDDLHFYIITAGHVVKTEKTVSVEFFHNGRTSHHIEATVMWTRYNYEFTEEDLCLLRVTKRDFRNFPLPGVIPLAGKGERLDKKTPMISVGCPNGDNPSIWKGVAVTHADELIPFVPAPLKGRSGAAICDTEAQFVWGVMVRRYETIGVAISSDKIREIESAIPQFTSN